MSLMRTQQSLLEGPLFANILRFSLPLILTNLLQTLYNAADMAVVGLSDTAGALGAIGNTSSMINLFFNLIMGYATGANVIVARHIGAGSREETEKTVHTAVCVGLLFGVLIGVVGFLACKPILVAMGAEGETLRLSVLYSRIYFSGTPLVALTNVFSAVLRAKGDTKTPLRVLSFSGLCNVALNLLFVLVFKMDVDGVSLATVLSNLLSTVILLRKLLREDGWCRLQLKKLKIHLQPMRDTLYIGIPAALNGAMFSVSNMQIQSAMIQMNGILCPGGSSVLDGYAAACTLDNIVYMLPASVCQAAMTFTSQHFGAGKYRRIGAVMKNCFLIAAFLGALCGGFVLLFEKYILRLFIHGDDIAFQTAHVKNLMHMTTYWILSISEVGTGVLRGLGRSVTVTVISFVGICVFRAVWILLVFPQYLTLESVYFSYPLSWILSGAFSVALSLIVWKKYAKQEP